MRVALLTLLATTAFGQAFHFIRHEIRDMGKERIIGAALEGKRLATWGDRILIWNLPDGRMQPLRTGFPQPPGPGGALFDVDLDGHADLVLNQAGGRRALFWIDLRTGKSTEIDHGISANEILPATLLGHRGILVVQRRIQVRFYEVPRDPAKPWSSRDMYSFYSPSDQGGLLLVDVDRDGRADIISGNYWIQCPEEFNLHWRLFAIRTWSEDKLSGMAQLALADLFGTGAPNLIVSQSEMAKARVAWLEKPANPERMWTEHRLEGKLELNQPRSLQVTDFNGNGKPDILVGERAGAGRLIVFSNEGGGRFAPYEAGRTSGVVDARVIDWNGDGRPDVVVVEPSSLSWWENAR